MVETAARLFGSRWCRGYFHCLSPVEKEWRESDWDTMRAGLGGERFEALYAEGKSLTYEQALNLAREVLDEKTYFSLKWIFASPMFPFIHDAVESVVSQF